VRRALLAVVLVATSVSAGELRPFVKGSWTTLRQAHQGRPLIVHFWGLTCAPCLGELPRWGALMKEAPRASVVFVAADPIPVEPSRVEERIASAGLQSVEHWIFSSSFVDPLRYEVNAEWAGELPMTLLIGRDGKITTLLGVADLEVVRVWIAQQGPGPGRR
jgi:thiol-disulfide isomerase/thioredoxin